jgi:hypothetical protein
MSIELESGVGMKKRKQDNSEKKTKDLKSKCAKKRKMTMVRREEQKCCKFDLVAM